MITDIVSFTAYDKIENLRDEIRPFVKKVSGVGGAILHVTITSIALEAKNFPSRGEFIGYIQYDALVTYTAPNESSVV